MTRQRGTILVGVLWCLALLSLVVVGVLHSARLELTVVKNYGDRVQAHYLALAGIEKTKALLYQDMRDRSRAGQNHSGELYDAPQQFKDVSFGRGQFRVTHEGQSDEGSDIIYGISDEESRLNINTITTNELGKFPNMSPELMAAILDWRDADDNVSPGGAEKDYYLSLQPPYEPRNGPVQTLKEMLMIRGVTRSLLFGDNANPVGPLDLGDTDEDETNSNASARAATDTGWSHFLTVNSTDDNVNASGEERVNVQSSDESSLTRVKGITSDIARAIIAYRGQNQFQSLADLLDVTATAQGQNGPQGAQPQGRGAQPASGDSGGAKVISDTLLHDIADDITIDSNQSQTGLVNVNTASAQVLSWLPGMDDGLAQAIVSYRKSAGYLPNIAALLKVPGMTTAIFKQVAPRVTVRSETFRIRCEGKVNSSGAKKRIEVVVHVDRNGVDTLSYEEGL